MLLNDKTTEYGFNANNRNSFIEKALKEEVDVVIVGGGITGAGLLLDASSRGLKAILIEKSDFASGTSSRSTKLIHGGLRYLKNFEFRLVHKIGKERAIVYKNAPHLVSPEKLILPITKTGTYKKWQVKWALTIYDLLAGVKKTDRRKIFNKQDTLVKEPLLRSNDLIGAGYYAEYRTDDARLTLEIIKSSFKYGGIAINYCEGIDLITSNGKINEIKCIDHFQNISFSIKAKKIINACGPWVDDFRKTDNVNEKNKIHLSKGVHIVVNHHDLPIKQAVYFDAKDNRMCFAIPRDKITYIGTTDSNYSGPIDDPEIIVSDVDYLINAINNAFDITPLKITDIISSWSGLRPLIQEKGKNSSELSRKDEIFISSSGLITIAGGKLSGYRLMAKKVIDIVCKELAVKKNCITKNIRINAHINTEKSSIKDYNKIIIELLSNNNLDVSRSNYLIRNYGSQSEEIIQLLSENNLKYLIEAEALFCLYNEAVYNPLDFFIRRTGKLYFEPSVIINELNIVLPLFKAYFSWDEANAKLMKEQVLNSLDNLTQFRK